MIRCRHLRTKLALFVLQPLVGMQEQTVVWTTRLNLTAMFRTCVVALAGYALVRNFCHYACT
jgi:hypothetical protein